MTSKKSWKIIRFGLFLLAMVFAVSFVCYAGSPTVTGLTVTRFDVEEKVDIHLSADSPLYYRVIATDKPRQALVIEASPAYALDNVVKTVQIDKGIVERARIERYKPGVVRLVVEVLQPVAYYVKAAPGGRGLILTVGTQTIAAKVSKAVPSIAAGNATVETPETVEPTKVTKKQENLAYKHKDLAAAKAKKKTKPVKLVTIDFVNADLIYVLKLLAKELQVNLVTDNTVQGAVTMSLKNVSAQTAMNIIIQMNGFKQKSMGNILFIGSEATLNAITPDVISTVPTADWVVQTIAVENIAASDATKAIKAQYPLVNVTEGPSGTVVIVNAPEKFMGDIRNLVAGIDVPQKETAPGPTKKVEIVRVKYATASDLSTTIDSILGDDAPEMKTDKRLNALILIGYDSQIQSAKNYMEELDVPLQQVMLGVKVVDLSESGSKSLGVNWSIGSDDGTSPMHFYEMPSGADVDLETDTQWTGGMNMPIGYFIREPFGMEATMSFLVQTGDATVLAQPRVATLSGESASIHIGDKYPIVYYDPRAGQYQVIYVDIGIKLEIEPTVSPDGYITTSIDPTVSTLLELINNQYPRTAERSASVNVRVKDGETIVIGGMVDERSRTSVSKVPLLGDLPILGQMFRATNVDRSKSEVVIMVTPKIIKM